ncbi:hypothetical protein P5V15_006554 [Pogonomyrmex californicus]
MARLNFIVTIIAITLTCVFAKELYSSQYDDIDIGEILNNEKLRLQYYNCFLDIAPCRTADAKFFKGIIGEAIQTQCRKCTEKQKENLDYMVDWYTKNQPEQWEAFVRKTIEDAQKKS